MSLINKEAQLGMPWGTAANRLKKAVMLHLLTQLKLDKCSKCGTIIDNPKDLSIDHKIDWLHIDVKLFWDMNNITFSHVRCNKTGRPNKSHTKNGPIGTLWCSGCKDYLPNDMFGTPSASRKRRPYCNSCRRSKSW